NCAYEGKIKNTADLIASDVEEKKKLESWLSNAPQTEGFQSWLNGQQVSDSGFFHTASIDGRDWLVPPGGHLYYASGINCMEAGSYALLDDYSRPAYSWLADGEKEFSAAVGRDSISFYLINLIRKWGISGWQTSFRQRAIERLSAWGFSCI